MSEDTAWLLKVRVINAFYGTNYTHAQMDDMPEVDVEVMATLAEMTSG